MSEWTLDSLKENLENEIRAVREAASKAESATEKRFDSVNEFRGALSDQATRLVNRNEYLTAHQSLLDKIDVLTVRVTATEGQARGSRLTMGGVVTAFSIAIAIITALILYLKP